MIYPQNFEQKIGFDEIRTLLTGHCLSTLGIERVGQMKFLTDLHLLRELQEQTREFLRIQEGEEDFPEQDFYDVRPAIKRIRIEGTYLDETELFDLKRSLCTIINIVRYLNKDTEEDNGTEENRPSDDASVPYPALRRLTQGVSVYPQLVRRIESILDKYGKIKDSASAELLRIRRELVAAESGISRTLHAILRNAQQDGVVDKDVTPTMRDGRLVIPVAPALKRKIKGIVHDESATGRTVFIEPAEVVEANNRIRELEGEERREIIRLLQEFTAEVRPHYQEILQSYEFLAEIDFIHAKAGLARQFNATTPDIKGAPLIDWTLARHPLLYLSLTRHGKKIVPLDIELNGHQRILIISGPNAGGKSVCLKTVGLIQYMLQCGLPVPIGENSRTGIFGSIFIDIGDEQSIEDDLSTYSSHLLNMKNMMKACCGTSLLLIDEFGGGTEPQIGGAIAEAVLKRFNQKKTFGIITTHYQNLKHFAEDHEGVVNGAHALRPPTHAGPVPTANRQSGQFFRRGNRPQDRYSGGSNSRCFRIGGQRVHQRGQVPARHRKRQAVLGKQTAEHPPPGKGNGEDHSPLRNGNRRVATQPERNLAQSQRRCRTTAPGIECQDREHH